MSFSFGSPAPAFGSSAPPASAAAPAAAATTPGVQTPGSTTAAAAAASTAKKGVSFSFPSSAPTFGGGTPAPAPAPTPTTPATRTPATPAAAPGGFPVGGGLGSGGAASRPTSAATSAAGSASSTPGVSNPLLRNGGTTPGLTRASSGGGSASASGVGAAGAAASFLSPPGSIGGSAGGAGRVTFAADNDAIASANAGLRRRRGGGASMSLDGKENDLMGSNILRKPNAGFGPPPKASLMTMSSAYDVPMETLGGDRADGSKKTAATAAKQATSSKGRTLVPASHAAPINTNPYASWVVVYGFANASQLNTVLNRFGTFGTVLSRHGGVSAAGSRSSVGGTAATNWVCLRYETSLQAEKALCQHGTFLDGGLPSSGERRAGGGGGPGSLIIVGVMRMDAALARTLGLAGPEGGVAPAALGAGGGGRSSNKSTELALLAEEDILLGGGDGNASLAGVPGRYVRGGDGGVCEKVLGWVFMW